MRFSTSSAGSSSSAPAAKAKLPEFDQLRDEARAIKDHTLAHLDLYLEAYERKVIESGGKVHFAPDRGATRATSCSGSAKTPALKLVTKGKSMVSEEIGLNAHLEAAGIEVVETDLGEYIMQIRGEAPSHIIAPVDPPQQGGRSTQDFVRTHRGSPRERKLGRCRTWWPRRGPCCARSSSPPMSASPAPTC